MRRGEITASWVAALAAALVIALSSSIARAQTADAAPAETPAPETPPTAMPRPGPPPPVPEAPPPPPFDHAPVASPPAAYPPPPGPGDPRVSDYRLTRPTLSGPVVVLRVDNPRARLQERRLRWETVCFAPCGRQVDPAGLYRIAGGTVNPSPTFQMPRGQGKVLVDAQVGSVVKYWVGFGVGVGGLATAAVGGLILAVANSNSNSTTAFGTTSDPNAAARAEGWTYIVVGAVMALVGLPLCLSSNTAVQVR